MHDPASELRRILLPRTRVNKGGAPIGKYQLRASSSPGYPTASVALGCFRLPSKCPSKCREARRKGGVVAL